MPSSEGIPEFRGEFRGQCVLGNAHLVTTGICAILRHPMYVGLPALHVGVPLVTGSPMILMSAVVWAGFITHWMQLGDQGLAKFFGPAYAAYKRQTWF